MYYSCKLGFTKNWPSEICSHFSLLWWNFLEALFLHLVILLKEFCPPFIKYNPKLYLHKRRISNRVVHYIKMITQFKNWYQIAKNQLDLRIIFSELVPLKLNLQSIVSRRLTKIPYIMNNPSIERPFLHFLKGLNEKTALLHTEPFCLLPSSMVSWLSYYLIGLVFLFKLKNTFCSKDLEAAYKN